MKTKKLQTNQDVKEIVLSVIKKFNCIIKKSYDFLSKNYYL
jgi:hypothetical protein